MRKDFKLITNAVKDIIFLAKKNKKGDTMSITVIKGDITKFNSDAIVNAANTSLLGGGGVDGAIHRAAGKELLAECRTLGGCKTGEARITKGYKLPAKYVIHTPGPIWRGGNYCEDELLESCYRNCIALAREYKCKTIAFPSISTGIYSFPVDRAAQIAMKVLKENDDLDISMVCFDEKTKEIYSDDLDAMS